MKWNVFYNQEPFSQRCLDNRIPDFGMSLNQKHFYKMEMKKSKIFS